MMVTEEQDHDASYLDEKEFQAKFLLDPDIPEDVKGQFDHIDKNLAITNLKQSRREGINEPDEARTICRGLHILNNKRYYREEVREVLEGYREEVLKNGNILRTPIFKQDIVLVPKFPKTYHAIKSSFITFVNTSASRQGHRIKAATTTRREKSESYEEKSNVNSPWGGSKRGN